MIEPCVYILASRRNGTLYIGVTGAIARRMYEHRTKCIGGFTSKYAVTMLVYYEMYQSMIDAITCEKQLKKWNREWKLRLIESFNPAWRDLYDDLLS